jgi:hypothetical protein
MPLKYPLVHELVIIVPDLFLPEQEAAASAPTLPGLERIARFGRRSALPQGWRTWLAQHLGFSELATAAPAGVAARAHPMALTGSLWLATPVHCVAGHAGVHLEQRGLLRLPATTLAALAADFNVVFKDSGVQLAPLPSGGFLLSGLGLPGAEAHSIEPARCVGVPMDGTLPVGRALQRLRVEIEIWLHEHPVNRERGARGELAVTGLWIWGGPASAPTNAATIAGRIRAQDRAFARDPYVDGLWRAAGAPVVPPPPARLEEIELRGVERTIVAVELAELLASQRGAGVGEALLALDAAWLLPATRLLSRGAWRELVLIANDRCITLARYDALKVWRRARRGLTGLL